MAGEIAAFRSAFDFTFAVDFIGDVQIYEDLARPFLLEKDRAVIKRAPGQAITFFQNPILYGGEQLTESNERAVILVMDLQLSYYLTNPVNENGWDAVFLGPDAKKHLFLESLLDPEYWTDRFTGFLGFISDPVVSNVGRTGNVMHLDVAVEFAFAEIP